MKKTYISPVIDICACLSYEFMISAKDMSDPGFKAADRYSTHMYYDEIDEDLFERYPNKLWIE